MSGTFSVTLFVLSLNIMTSLIAVYISVLPFADCEFEDNPAMALPCNFTVGGDGVWKVSVGPKPDPNSGPNVDHTLGTDAGKD